MIEIREVKTKKEQKEFMQFPIDLYKGNKCFVPPLWMDEKKIFTKNFVYADTCESVFYNAYEDGKMVGRIEGILQKASNEKENTKRIRFTRFDSINSQEVANKLFEAVENWAKQKGMDTVCGPLNYSDLEREGLLIEGFDQLSTFEEQYNADYYQTLIENCGYKKEVDWYEFKLYLSETESIDQMKKTAEFVMKRYNLHYAEAKNVNAFLDKYADKFFALLDESYKNIFGTVPFTDGMKKMTIDNFKLIINLKNVIAIVDENDNMVCLGICFASIAKALQKSGGHLTPSAIVKVLSAIKDPKIIDLGLVGVDPTYLNRGISAVVCYELMRMLKETNIEYAETNLNLEDNYSILNMWKHFNAVQHKKRRSYIKVIGD